jgi:DNA-binding beta-propeller fold protein YncE
LSAIIAKTTRLARWFAAGEKSVVQERFDTRVPAVVLRFLLLCLALAGLPSAALAQERLAPTRSIAQITVDDDGRQLYLPTAVFFDPVEEEIYLVNNGSARVVVYGPDFFPRMSIGAGRSVAAPFGVHVTKSGHVYIPQPRNAFNPVNRITILNAAFFVEREIIVDDIPEAKGVLPKQVAVNRDGLIYLVGEASRGVLVLDSDGTFLRRIQPMDMIMDRAAIEASAREQEELTRGDLSSVVGEQEPVTKRPSAEIPEEFRPQSSREEGAVRTGPGLGPVRVRYVHIDSTGKLYLVSAETGKIYVYSPEEELLFTFGEKGGTPRKLSQPYALDIDEKRGLIYVVDYMRQTILTYNLAGKWLFEVGGRGSAPGWFYYPMDIAINRYGHIIVSDFFNRRIQVLEVEYGGEFPMFKSEPPPAPDPEVTEDAEQAATETDSPGTPEGEAETEAAPLTDAPGKPDDVIEEVILPDQELPVPPDAATEQETVPAQ